MFTNVEKIILRHALLVERKSLNAQWKKVSEEQCRRVDFLDTLPKDLRAKLEEDLLDDTESEAMDLEEKIETVDALLKSLGDNSEHEA